MSLLQRVLDELDVVDIFASDEDTVGLMGQIEDRVLEYKSVIRSNAIVKAPVAEGDKQIESETATPEILDELWMLKAGYMEAEGLLNLGKLSLGYQSLASFRDRSNAFIAQHPGSLLSRDLELTVKKLEHALTSSLASSWSRIIRLQHTANAYILTVEPNAQDDITAILLNDRSNLLESFLSSIGEVFDAIVSKRVSTVDDEERTLTATLGELKSVDDLIFVSQDFVLGLGNVLGPYPDVLDRIKLRYGHHFVDSLIQKTLPSWFPTDPLDLDSFERELQGVKGLEEVLRDFGWTKGHELSEFSDTFKSTWNTHQLSHFLDQIRAILSGEFASEEVGDSQPFSKDLSKLDVTNEDEDEWAWGDEEPTQGTNPSTVGSDERTPSSRRTVNEIIIIIQESISETGLPADPLVAIFRALAPRFYGSHGFELYADSMKLIESLEPEQISLKGLEALKGFAGSHIMAKSDELTKELETKLRTLNVSNPANNFASSLIARIDETATETRVLGSANRDTILAQLVEQIAHHIVSSILAQEDIGDQQSKKLSKVIGDLGGLGKYFVSVELSVPSWIKLQRLGDILAASLVTIQTMFESSMLVDFSVEELEGLVMALFADSDHRQLLLNQIYQSG